MDRTDREAMSIIKRAAILLEERNEGCLTPGAEWETKVKGNGTISVKVTLPVELAEKLNEQLSQEYKHEYIDNLLHSYMQVAVWRILEGKLV